MNATQLRILFDYWAQPENGPFGSPDPNIARLIQELVEAGGLPKPSFMDLRYAREALAAATALTFIQHTSHVYQESIDSLMDRYNRITADWTVS